jgi:predicted RNase H-like nuclease (RuvC/YqgF family)
MSQFEETLCEPRIKYEWYLTGPQGARYILYPIKDVHSKEDVNKAKAWIHKNFDVVSLQVRWIKEDDDSPMPERLPDEAIISNLRQQLGAKEAYIEELEEKLKDKEVSQDKQHRQTVKKEDMYKSLEKQLNKAKKEIIRLHKAISDCVTSKTQQQ